MQLAPKSDVTCSNNFTLATNFGPAGGTVDNEA
jgi:hypothetical protein